MFAKIKDGAVDKFPYSVGDLRRDNPNTSFPKQLSDATMAAFGMVAVIERPAPDFDPTTHFAEWGPVPVNEGGQWFLLPTVRELSAEQIADRDAALAASIRYERDALLAKTDWMALFDVGLTPEMASYRQALRDITAQAGFPHNVAWPVKPE
jgi:hypothetical protein